ncbi:TonB-dependent receptor domain-containing protein [Aquisalinus flavus]|uniref:TonB-dependent receptor n=1 Tax=Aquisalinus flavus TaxID=1526572 RepID=A0A8J2Y7V5_9PROT|nr:TonB-dependent receptor [Aquisalinus flavus]GGD07494.1 TonB-dependent receptor [Aquisalinus flavus]
MKENFKKSILTSSAIALLASMAVPAAVAQDEEGAESSSSDVITITGSRIPQDPNLASSVPVQSVDDEDIRLSGELNLADVVNDIPALISSLTAENSATGANQLNLRGLGANRTLTLVNGRRHVAGFRGSQSVDIGSIPRALVERVEVTTGGASAVYGSDAVTGVVNFILKDDFEGLEINARGGISSRTDAENFSLDAIYGKNFADGRGNVVLTLGIEEDTALTYGDRPWSKDNGIATTEPNANPDPDGPSRAVIEDPRFWLTSQEGSIAPTFGGRGVTYVDINNNGVADCQESAGGRASFLAGCWLTNPDGSVRVNQDGIVLNGLWGIGGDGGRLNFNRDTLLPETDKIAVNLNSKFEVTPTLTAFFEGKYVIAESTTFGEQDTFYDTLFILPDNPFIPEQLLPVVDVTGGLLLTQDPLDFSDDNPTVNERETYRFVGGVEWEPVPGHIIEVSANHGVFKNTQDTTGLYLDRIFASIDATTDASGNAVCRSDLDPGAFYEIDYFTALAGYADGGFASNRYYSFTPGDGQCQPLNPFGTYSASKAAQDFVTADLQNVLEVKQTVFSAIAAGQFDRFQFLLDGPIGYAAGVEYREESSDNKLDPLTLGILPEGTSLTAGEFVGDIDPWLNSFTSIDNDRQFNTSGEYDVAEVFGEIRLPILRDKPFAHELTLDAATRFADYSTLGEATTWKVGATWAPIEDLTFRATVSEAVRAPNISELFDPPLPITISATADPCDPGSVDGGTAARPGNCIAALQAAGVPNSEIQDGSGDYIWVNPLTGRFSGTSGGNPDLDAETSESLTVGAIYTPSFIEGLSLTVDYWQIEIVEAIGAVSAQDILNGCLDSVDYPNVPFCDLFSRRGDGGLDDLSSGQINFASQEAEGVDVTASYSFDVGPNTFGARLVGSHQEKLDNFFNPSNLSETNSDVGEVQLPELSGNLTLSWDNGPFGASFQTTYQDKQTVDFIEADSVLADGTVEQTGLERHLELYGDGAYFDETYIFDANFDYEFNEKLSLYGGINNITDVEPFATQTAWPVGPRGRFYFLGITYRQ